MQLAFGWYNIIELLFCLVALWMGIRDLQGKDPLIHTFFNQYDREPEYRAIVPSGRRKTACGRSSTQWFLLLRSFWATSLP